MHKSIATIEAQSLGGMKPISDEHKKKISVSRSKFCPFSFSTFTLSSLSTK